jgi:hypothetical protein
MAGDRAGHRVRIEQIDEYRRTARTRITLEFEATLPMKLLVSASSSTRGQAHWSWLAVAAVFFAAGIWGALAARHAGPLVVCLGGALLLWGWLAARRSTARRRASSVRLGDPALDGILHIETDDPARVTSRLGSRRAGELLSGLAGPGRELMVTEKKIALEVDRLLSADPAIEAELSRLVELASLLGNR